MIIWIVTSGRYSDYQVHCAFTTEHLATDYAARRAGLTPDEYADLLRFWNDDALWGKAYHAAFARLPDRIRQASYGEWRVDSLQLHDASVVLTEEEVEEARKSTP